MTRMEIEEIKMVEGLDETESAFVRHMIFGFLLACQETNNAMMVDGLPPIPISTLFKKFLITVIKVDGRPLDNLIMEIEGEVIEYIKKAEKAETERAAILNTFLTD